MTPFFTRVSFAFSAFFSILFHDRIPDDVGLALGGGPPPPPPAPAQETTTDATATQVLAVLQRDGRLIDFLMENIAPYSDAQIGAAVRDVHRGCRQALDRYLTLTPVLEQEESSTVTIETGTDAAMVKVIGNVSGPAPFRGVLRHRGWVANRIELPPLPRTGRFVVAPAEVEIA